MLLEISNINTALSNALRRTMIADVPTYAIEVVSILKNNSIFNDEILAHRLGLIPLKVLKDSTGHKINLKIKFNKNLCCINDIHTVYANDLEYDRSVYQIEPNIIIIKLAKGHEIDLETTICKGTGYEHAKWSPVCTASYRENETKKSYTFTIETNGSMDPLDVFNEAIQILKKKIFSFINPSVQQTEGTIEKIFKDENHTLAILLQHYLLNDSNVLYAAYSVPDPLDKTMYLKYILKDYTIDSYTKCLESIVVDLDNLRQ